MSLPPGVIADDSGNCPTLNPAALRLDPYMLSVSLCRFVSVSSAWRNRGWHWQLPNAESCCLAVGYLYVIRILVPFCKCPFRLAWSRMTLATARRWILLPCGWIPICYPYDLYLWLIFLRGVRMTLASAWRLILSPRTCC